MDILRTPDERFVDLPDYPFAPHWCEIDGLRLHYLDEGPRDAPIVLLLHGEPTWSYLYRKMIPPLVAGGRRVIAPDLIGFGKSDKPTRMADYSYARHVGWIGRFLEQLDLRGLTLFCQDWGSLIGLRLAAEQPARFERLVIANGFLPTATTRVPAAFRLWRAFARYSPWFPIGRIVNSGCVVKLSAAEIAAYDAPFPDARYKAGTRAFPRLVPIDPADPAVPANREAWRRLGEWHQPVLCLFGRNDPILGRADAALIAHIPGARGQPHQRTWGGHFIQEDRGAWLAEQMLAWRG
ncbi:MAG TPA: haloalkane dehalogenase [Nevskiaceae bacterium]|nr:haloalkane dehalogenase [Nevskiaceae bacterium]